ncbi:MAG: hypothetical protein ABWZ78_07630, partial [Burkholderiaceae bacterium]
MKVHRRLAVDGMGASDSAGVPAPGAGADAMMCKMSVQIIVALPWRRQVVLSSDDEVHDRHRHRHR